jgi:tetratricopeptide (TPR) repeat protein
MNDRTKTISLAVVIAIGMIATIGLARFVDVRRPPVDVSANDDSLYLNARTAERISLGFNGLAADWYWMRSLQYVGKKIISQPGDVALDDLSKLNLKLLAPLLDTASTLDPEFLDPYEYAAIVLPAVDVNEAIRITQKGIAANPNAWRLYQHLGYIYWQQGDYQAASETYGRGAQIPGVPSWMLAMKAKMVADGGGRNTAREIYTRMFEESADEQVKDMARKHLWLLDSLDQRDVLRKVIHAFRDKTGRCPAAWAELREVFRVLSVPVDAAGSPLDPSGAPYILNLSTCDVQLNPKSEVPIKYL